MRLFSFRRLLVVCSWLTMMPLLASAAPNQAQAGGKRITSAAKKKGAVRRGRHPVFSGYQVPEVRLRSQPLKRPSGKLEMTSINDPKAYLLVNIYNSDGSFNDEALDKLNHLLRCRRSGTEKAIDPHLFEILSHVYDHFGKPLDLVSGFRNQERTTSFHFQGSASDIRIVGVPEKELKEFVESLDTGGMGIGIYPHGHFIHVDIRPEPSYRWVDFSPPGGGKPAPKRRRAPNT